MNQSKPFCTEHGPFFQHPCDPPLKCPPFLYMFCPDQPVCLFSRRLGPDAELSHRASLSPPSPWAVTFSRWAHPVLGLWLSLWSPWLQFLMTWCFTALCLARAFPPRAEDRQFTSTASPRSLAESRPSLQAGDCTIFLGCICPCHLQSGHSYSSVKGLYLLHWNRKLRVSEIKKNTYPWWSGSEKRASFGRESLISGSSPCKMRIIILTLRITVRVRDIDRKCPA